MQYYTVYEVSSNLGNGQSFVGVAKKIVDGDLQYVRYVQKFGCLTLTVFNT